MPQILKKEKVGNRRIFYLFGHKVLSYHKRGGGLQLSSIEAKLQELDAKISRIDAKTELAFLSKITHLPRRAQLGQDLIAYILHNGKKDGFFVDIGANDGVEISNSLLFEELGWKGFCVEANPKTFEKLRQNRQCDCYNLAVFSKNIGKTKMAITSCDGLDSLEINLTDNHRKRMQYEGGRDEEIQFIDVQTATFGELMQNYPNTHHIDFLSLDIEGGEFEVLKGIDFDKYTFSLMAIEHNFVDSAIEEITRFLKSKGYRMLMFNAWDFFFVPDERIGWEQSYKLKLI